MAAGKRSIDAREFKAYCLALLDFVAETGRSIVVTKRRRPVAEVVALQEPRSLRGSVLREGDLIAPVKAAW